MHRTTALPLHLLIVVWLLLDIGQFKPVMFPAVLGFEPYAEQHGDDAAACEDHQRKRIVVGRTVDMAGVAEFERIADHGREEAQPDVLNPEDQRVCRTQIAGLHDLGNRRPEGRGNPRER